VGWDEVERNKKLSAAAGILHRVQGVCFPLNVADQQQRETKETFAIS
jgi:hypothetical protein